jgi:hypothetical protein
MLTLERLRELHEQQKDGAPMPDGWKAETEKYLKLKNRMRVKIQEDLRKTENKIKEAELLYVLMLRGGDNAKP